MAMKLRFGVMCNNYTLQQWQHRIVDELLALGHEPVMLIMPAPLPVQKKNRLFRKPQTAHQFWLYRFCERFLFRPPSRLIVAMNDSLRALPVRDCTITTKGYSQYFDNADIEFIRSQRLDFILRFGFNIIRGDILESATYGIWSYHHSDEQLIRGGPAGFWEIYHNMPVTGTMLQRLTNHLDGGIVLRKGWFRTISHSYSRQIDQLLNGSVHFVKQVCNDIVAGNKDCLTAAPGNSSAPVFRIPTNGKMVMFLLRLMVNRIRYHWDTLIRSETWNVGIIHTPLSQVVTTWKNLKDKIQWLPVTGRNVYRADPFVFSLNNKPIILCERYNYGRLKGNIEFVGINPVSGLPDDSKQIITSWHQSFPYVVEHDGRFYCVPESSQTKVTNLYMIDIKNLNLNLVRTLVNQPVIDPALFQYEGRWWLFGMLPSDSHTALHVWFAESLQGVFLPHPQNPVKTDVRSSRPAGTIFFLDGTPIRPAQNGSITYGGSIVLNRILRLTPTDFSEETLTEIFPSAGWHFNKGIHTISGSGSFTVVDAKRYSFSARATVMKMMHKFHRATTQI